MKNFFASLFTLGFLISAEIPAEWKYVQTVRVEESGLVKMPLPLETLSSARIQGEDIRLQTETGKEIPYVLEFPASVVLKKNAARDFKTSVAGNTTRLTIETGSEEILSAVELETPAPNFFKSAKIEGSTDGGTWKVLRDGAPFFHQDGIREQKLTFPDGIWSHLRITIDDSRTPPVVFTRVLLHAAPEAVNRLAIPVTLESRVEEDGVSRIKLRFPFAHLFLSDITIDSPESVFRRTAILSEWHFADGEIREKTLAEDILYRIPQGSKISLAASGEKSLTLAAATLAIDNADNAPLKVSGVRAWHRPVHLVFYSEGPGTLRLLTGNAVCAAPRYDLASLGGQLKSAKNISPKAGPHTLNPAFILSNEFQDIPALGAFQNLRAWKHQKSLTAFPGVAEWELDDEVLAGSHKSLRDLRLMNGDKQVPFLLVRNTALRKTVLGVKKNEDPKRPTWSIFELSLPLAGLPLKKILFEANAPYFERIVRLLEKRTDERGNTVSVELGQGVWKRLPGQARGQLLITLRGFLETGKIIFETDNGDNPKLILDSATATYTTSRILYRSLGDKLSLHYGNEEAESPRYDLELAAGRLLQAEKVKPVTGSAEKLAASKNRFRLEGMSGWIFWTALILVVFGLLWVIVRLLPKEKG